MPPPRKGRAAAMLVSLAVMGSRVLGLVRDQVFAAMFGANRNMDAFVAAFQIPNLFRDLFAEGALSTAFTTIFAKTSEKEGESSAWDLSRLVLSAMLLLLGTLCLAGILLSPLLVSLTSYGFHQVPGKFEQTVLLTRIMFPFILFVSLAALVMSMLNARHIFGIPAMAPMAFNLVSVAASVALAYVFEPQMDPFHPHFTGQALPGLALGALLGGLAQLTFQLPALWREGFRYHWRLELRNPRLRAIWQLMWPAMLAASVVELNVLINCQFASGIDGARSWLTYAFRIVLFPIGMFGVAIATVLLPSVARCEANQDRAAFGRHVEEALRLCLFLAVPAGAGLAALAPEIVALLYQHGAWSAASTAQTAAALRAYAVGLAGYAGIKVLVPCFYALSKPQIPLKVNLIAVGINLVLNALLVLVFRLGHVGVASATAIVVLVNFAQLALRLRHDVPLGTIRNWMRLAGTVSAGGLLCGLGAWEAVRLMQPVLPAGLAGQAALVAAGIGCGTVLYGAFTLACRLPEPLLALRLVRQKLARR